MFMNDSGNSSFLPFDIPGFRSRNMRIGQKGLLRRSFPRGQDEFFRIYQDEELTLEVEFQRQEPDASVRLYTNLGGSENDWRELDFEKKPDGTHRFSRRVEKRGNYQFKIKYSLDGGESWFWDRLPFSRVIVDPASLKDIRMYTLIPTVSGTVDDWIKDLPRIADLGFNTVHLLPLTELDESQSPYAAGDLFSIDAAYRNSGNLQGFDDLRRFVEAARDRGIRLCFDLTLNHIGVRSRMVRECPEWIVPDRNEKDGMKRAGCWHMNTWLTWNDLVNIYYDHPHAEIRADIWDYMTRYSLFWAHFASLTGGMVRLDNLHSSHEEFITHLLPELRGACPDLVIMAEFFTDSNTVLKRAAEWQIDCFLANPWEYPYAADLRRYIRYLHDIGSKVRYFVPITTHDTGTPAQLFGAPDAAVPRYAATALMGTGRTGIVQGTEYGLPEKINFIGRRQKVDFDQNRSVTDGIQKINDLFARWELFHHEGNIDFVDGDHGAVLGALRRMNRNDDEGFLVLANLDVNNRYSLPLDLSSCTNNARALVLTDVFSGSEWTLSAENAVIDIEPCGIRVLQVRMME
ncbi:MAG: hypothetical protein AVO39_08015 [delta proteobacterium MLS_D]|nr:MAG: hypothetical protein AVO39_08015 [delta proteobacterium MLS_D]